MDSFFSLFFSFSSALFLFFVFIIFFSPCLQNFLFLVRRIFSDSWSVVCGFFPIFGCLFVVVEILAQLKILLFLQGAG